MTMKICDKRVSTGLVDQKVLVYTVHIPWPRRPMKMTIFLTDYKSFWTDETVFSCKQFYSNWSSFFDSVSLPDAFCMIAKTLNMIDTIRLYAQSTLFILKNMFILLSPSLYMWLFAGAQQFMDFLLSIPFLISYCASAIYSVIGSPSLHISSSHILAYLYRLCKRNSTRHLQRQWPKLYLLYLNIFIFN